MTQELGPQCSSDDAFTARMRLHQSWYRAHVLDVPCGVGPGRGSKTSYGNMLRHEDGERGLNFLTPDIAQLARMRQAELPAGIERHRLLCNMLSSPPMCFNLFAPIALDAALAPSLLAALIDEPVERVARVMFEHAPSPLAEYLDDGTSFDAFVEYRGPDGALRFVGIETKLTEPFSARRYALDQRAAYRRWIVNEGPWRMDRLGDLDRVSHNQLFRDHLLAVAVATRDHETYRAGKLAIVRHREDTKCERSIASYQACLRPGSWYQDRTLDDIVSRWRPFVDGAWATWLDAFERRYVDMTASAATRT